MKKLPKMLAVLFICTFMGMNNPVNAQTTDNNTSTANSVRNDDDNDSGKYGLAGLLGLLGLLGLRKRDDDRHRTNINR